jgi:Rieske Fe-S protein
MTSTPEDVAATAAATRRAVLAGAGAAGLAVGLAAAVSALSGCAGTDSGDATSGDALPATLATSAVPVGGGTVVADAQVVVTQPTRGVFKAFSAVCTHQGCLISGVVDNRIICPCHNSVFSATTGSVVAGPANRALPAHAVTVSGDTLTVS